MSMLIVIILMGPAAALGIYKPAVMVNGKCIAEPGTFAALHCVPEEKKLKWVRKRGK